MPLYDFQDTETGEVFELNLRIAEKDDFLKANPNLKQVIGAPMIVGGVDGLRKPMKVSKKYYLRLENRIHRHLSDVKSINQLQLKVAQLIKL